MELILLEKVEKIGNIGNVVIVKNGYGRNYLIPKNKAIRATKSNIEHFKQQKKEFEAENQVRKKLASNTGEAIAGQSILVIRQAGEDGRLYGSVTARDITDAIKAKTGHTVHYSCIQLNAKFKEIGLYQIKLALHPEVIININLSIARSAEEAAAEGRKHKG